MDVRCVCELCVLLCTRDVTFVSHTPLFRLLMANLFHNFFSSMNLN